MQLDAADNISVVVGRRLLAGGEAREALVQDAQQHADVARHARQHQV